MPLRLPSFEFFYVWLLVAACRGRGYRQSESNTRLKICLVFLLSCSSLVPQYLATSGTNDETRERRRRRRRKRSPTRRLPTIKSLFTFPLLVRGYSWHRGSVEPRPPSNHEHMPLFGAVKPYNHPFFMGFTQWLPMITLYVSFFGSCGYPWHRGSVEARPPSNHEHMPFVVWGCKAPSLTTIPSSLAVPNGYPRSLFTFPLLVPGYSWHRSSVEPRPPSNHEHMRPGVSAPPLR